MTTSVRRVRTFRWRQIKTIDKSSNLDRVHLAGFKAMHLLELGGFRRIKVAAAASKSLPRFDIICLSRIPLASTRQRLLRLRRAAQHRHHTSALRTLRRHLGFLGPRNHSASLGLALLKVGAKTKLIYEVRVIRVVSLKCTNLLACAIDFPHAILDLSRSGPLCGIRGQLCSVVQFGCGQPREALVEQLDTYSLGSLTRD